MVKKWLFGVVFSLALVASLFSGALVSGAQTPPSLTETYTWDPYGLSISYPGDWVVTQKSKAISVHPDGLDVTDGLGPELILFKVDDPRSASTGGGMSTLLAQIAQNFAADSNGEVFTLTPGMMDRYLTQNASIIWQSPLATGSLLVIGLDLDTVLGVAYIVEGLQAASYGPLLQAIFDSVTFGTPRTDVTGTVSTSASVASVQLPQRYTWQDTGLVLYFPAGWEVESDKSGLQLSSVYATPSRSAPSSQDSYQIQAAGYSWSDSIDLHEMATDIASSYGGVESEIVDTVIAGYPAVVYDILDQTESPDYRFRNVLIHLSDEDVVVPIYFGAEVSAWNDFRPIASAFISNIERLGSRISLVPGNVLRQQIANGQPDPAALPRQDGDTRTYVWEDYGVTFTLPSTWQTIMGNGQDFDLALVTPEAMSSGTGTFITIRVISNLGPGVTLESALQSVADQVKSTVTPFSTAGLDGATVDFTDEASGALQHLILLPYGDKGEVLYFQTLAASADDDVIVLDLLNTMVINPPVPDHAVIDAAWQASLAANGTLVYGSADAPVHVTEYLDFSCSHCASYSYKMEHLIPLEADLGTISLEYVLLDTIGGDLSTQAAQATYCATEQGKGYSAYKALFAGYMNEGRDVAYTPDGIAALLGADEVGVDVEALQACMSDGKYMDVITQSRTRAADAGVTGTPSLLLAKGSDTPAFLTLPSGDQWSGEIPIGILRTIIQTAIANDQSLQDAASAYFNQ